MRVLFLIDFRPRPDRGASLGRFALYLAALFLLIHPGRADAQDAKSILRNMMKTYRELASYQGRASADRREVLANGKVLINDSLSTIIFYQKPNKLRLEFTMPSGGRSIYYDGSALTFFESRPLTYTVKNLAASNLQGLLEPLMRLQVFSKLDTLFFLAGKDLPASVTGLKRLPDSTRSGRSVYVVSAQEPNPSTKNSIIWTWMIDKKTNLLARVEGRIPNVEQRIRLQQGKKQVTRSVRVDSVLTQNIIEAKPNAHLDGKTFTFAPPTGSKKITEELSGKGN